MEPDLWLGVEVRHLAALTAIAQEGSFGRAAARLGYTQSAVSQQIAMLERIVGERLIDRPRGSRTVQLTEVGELLLRHGEAIVARLQAARSDVEAVVRGDAGSLRVGTFQSVGTRVLPELMRRFMAEWRNVDVRLVEEHDDRELVAAVERGDIDLSFAMLPVGTGPFEGVHLLSDRYVLLLPCDVEAPPSPLPLAELRGMRLIGNRSCRAVPNVEEQLERAGIEHEIVFRSDDNTTVQALVAAGVGAALVPRLTVSDDPAIQVVETDAALVPRQIGIVWHRDRRRSPAARRFVELAQTLCAQFDDERLAA